MTKKRGRGIACMYYGIGKTGHPGPASAFAEILDNGEVVIMTGLADMGQGANTGIAQIAADTLGVPVENVLLVTGDTGRTPDAGVTSASRSTYVVGNAVRHAVLKAMEPILREAVRRLEVQPERIVVEGGRLYEEGNPDNAITLLEALAACRALGEQTVSGVSFNPEFQRLDDSGRGDPYPTYAFATQIAEVEVDTETGQVEVLRIVAAHDVGRAINPDLVEAQIQGGIAQGIGYALSEDLMIEEGVVVNPYFSTYLLPTSVDVSEIESILIEDEEPSGPFGAKGVAEPALIPTVSAIVGAIYDAVGVVVTQLPAKPELILAALEQASHNGQA